MVSFRYDSATSTFVVAKKEFVSFVWQLARSPILLESRLDFHFEFKRVLVHSKMRLIHFLVTKREKLSLHLKLSAPLFLSTLKRLEFFPHFT